MDLVRYDYPNEGMIIKLEGRNTDIPFYGLSDLLELIDLIAADKEDKVMDVFFTFWIWGPGSQLGYFLLQRLGLPELIDFIGTRPIPIVSSVLRSDPDPYFSKGSDPRYTDP